VGFFVHVHSTSYKRAHQTRSDNNVGPLGVKEIASMLKHNSTLKELILSWNRIGDEGVTELARALEQNTSLEELWLWSTFLEQYIYSSSFRFAFPSLTFCALRQ